MEGVTIYFDADGTYLCYEDGQSTHAYYLECCREQGGQCRWTSQVT